MTGNDLKKVIFAPPEASGLGLTSFHRLMGATEGKAMADVTKLVQRRAEKLKRVKNELRDVAAFGLASPAIYR